MLELVKTYCGDNYIELDAKQGETVDKIFEIYGDNSLKFLAIINSMLYGTSENDTRDLS